MSEDKVKPIDKGRLPWYCRLILKIPGADFVESASSGIYWGISADLPYTRVFLNISLLVFFPFQINIVLVLITPVGVLLVFLRVSLERFINWWNSAVDDSFEWNVDKSMPEYLELLKKKEKRQE
jgi:hypothetical protein